MNKVNNNIIAKKISPSHGSFWSDGDGRIYMLALVSPASYAAVCLNNGNRWSASPKQTAHEAVKGLHFIASEVKVTIDPI